MSTTFEVFPGTPRIPTVGEVLEAGEAELARFVAGRPVRMSASLGSDERARWPRRVRRPRERARDEPFWCEPGEYLWIRIEDVAGGTDVYVGAAHDFPEHPHQLYEGPRADEIDIERHLAAGHAWTFRRSMGQPCVVNLAYGLLAGCLARLTDGVVYSDDNAWVSELLPATGPDFLGFYFVLDRTPGGEHYGWARQCLGDLDGDFT